ncbi:MAG: (Fe-S)-binding protein [Gammaproteobacteria bacterium]|nr:(Fe-S)-binding protein [Gammaproteobacteria bacterium]MDH5652520.1 (Fe-S)-binding protein [Gammaproteobacteria bacterium]
MDSTLTTPSGPPLTESIHTSINLLADRCVKCGLCLPHCPTYSEAQNENESPRGRIALLQGLVNGRLHYSATLASHLDHCLLCRRCERVCPSGVKYGRLLDKSRQWMFEKGLRRNRFAGFMLSFLTHKRRLKTGLFLVRLYQRSGLQFLFRMTGLLRLLRLEHLDNLLPDSIAGTQKWLTTVPTSGKKIGRVGLFTGCLGEQLDSHLIDCSIKLLNRLGYDVLLPSRQTCCGAMHQHHGDIVAALALAEQNIQAFAETDQLVYLATGCGVSLQDYANLPWRDAEQVNRAAEFVARAREITDFINQCDLGSLPLQPLPVKISMHSPCSEANQQTSRQLLQHIPEIDLELLSKDRCCGSAGSYMLTQPALAAQLRDKTISQISHSDADIVTTTNLGCALHLRTALPKHIRLLHPIEVLSAQLFKEDGDK